MNHEYTTAVRRAREAIGDALEQFYAPFQTWNDLQKLILVLGLVFFIGYVAARPPRFKRRYDGETSGQVFVLCTMLAVGSFVTGLTVYTGV